MEINHRYRFYIRLGKSRQDRELAAYISADRERGVNVSKLAKRLLYNYYTGAVLPGYSGPVIQQPSEDSRQQVLSAKLKKLNFESLIKQ